GAFIASKEMMGSLKEYPKLGHITTFGGHPVIAAAGLATITELNRSNLVADCLRKEQLIRTHLQHPSIKEIRGKGLMLALLVETPELASKIILKCLDKGLLLFWLLFEGRAIRITPPLTISDDEIQEGCKLLLKVINEVK
ncbi:MAG: aminotransferase class III-fold pyridoxal phosphate-dependent enzyme, partial [Flavobacteriaceae bacterium]|nr:aminotransferase class III-fold pyridoxal phosphate-dependent enzyme [Flavobacteriaceae bacterium]